MFSEIRKRVKKAGHPPGTPIYTGSKADVKPTVTVFHYDPTNCTKQSAATLTECLPAEINTGTIWVNIDGLGDAALINQVAEQFKLHPLTVEDVLNVEQRPKVEEFDHYVFITIKALRWLEKKSTYQVKQISIIFGENFVLTFQESPTNVFKNVQARLESTGTQRMRQQSSDYLVYRLIDAIVDEYFIVFDELGDLIESTERRVTSNPTPKTARSIYTLKRQMLLLRKAIWPMRETIGHLLHGDEDFITKFTRVYLRDLYDHTIQAIDTVETFRDMLSGILDMYLTGLSNRMNEIMKTLTIITTIFVPITAIASIYGMNFDYIPGLKWQFGYTFTVLTMVVISIVMVIYFRLKKWI